MHFSNSVGSNPLNRRLRNRFMQVRIEGLPYGIDSRKAESVQHPMEVGMHQPDALSEGVISLTGGLKRTIKVVNQRQQLANDAGNRAEARLRNLLVRPLPIVLKIGLSPKRQVLELIALLEGPRKLIQISFQSL